MSRADKTPTAATMPVMSIGITTTNARLILASKSPRRAALLREAGFIFEQVTPRYDDPPAPRGDGQQTAQDLAGELAMHKAQSLAGHVQSDRLLLAADTICVNEMGELIGQPSSRADAKQMIQSFVNRTHDVVTGVALLHEAEGQTMCFADTAVVLFGDLSDAQLDAYLDTQQWHGKAGGYNLFDRQRDGWPITVEGDPTTVVGLPMQRLSRLLPQFGVHPRSALAQR